MRPLQLWRETFQAPWRLEVPVHPGVLARGCSSAALPPLSPRVCLSSCEDTVLLELPPTYCDLVLTHCICKDPISEKGHVLSFCEARELGDP